MNIPNIQNNKIQSISILFFASLAHYICEYIESIFSDNSKIGHIYFLYWSSFNTIFSWETIGLVLYHFISPIEND